MLIVSRKKNESIIIAENIEVTVLEVQGERVKIGIEAPNEVKIVRKELLETEKFNKTAADTGAVDLAKLKGLLKKK